MIHLALGWRAYCDSIRCEAGAEETVLSNMLRHVTLCNMKYMRISICLEIKLFRLTKFDQVRGHVVDESSAVVVLLA